MEFDEDDFDFIGLFMCITAVVYVVVLFMLLNL